MSTRLDILTTRIINLGSQSIHWCDPPSNVTRPTSNVKVAAQSIAAPQVRGPQHIRGRLPDLAWSGNVGSIRAISSHVLTLGKAHLTGSTHSTSPSSLRFPPVNVRLAREVRLRIHSYDSFSALPYPSSCASLFFIERLVGTHHSLPVAE